MLATTTPALAGICRSQVRRDPWPDFESFEAQQYSDELRRAAAHQWAGRARAEHGSVHQFTALGHALSEARAPLQLLGSLGRLITDEVRHAELCVRMAMACRPGSINLGWAVPKAPWGPAPSADGDVEGWAAEAILIACCVGETLSAPMLEAIAIVATDPVAEGVARQILRDEHLHATFGWESLAFLLQRGGEPLRDRLQARLGNVLHEVERTTCGELRAHDVANSELEIVRGEVNLGTLSERQYAQIFYATLEHDILPRFDGLGFDAFGAWKNP